MIYRVKKKFAWTETIVHKILSPNASKCLTVHFMNYYVIERKVNDKWELAPNTSQHFSEEDAYAQIKLLYKYGK